MNAITLLTRGRVTPGYNPAVTMVTWGMLFFRNPNIVIPDDYVPLFIVGPQQNVRPGFFLGLSHTTAPVNGGINSLFYRANADLTAAETVPFIDPKEHPLVQASSSLTDAQVEFIDPSLSLIDVGEEDLNLLPKIDADFIDNDN